MLFPKCALCSLVLLILHLECDRELLLALGVPGHGFALCLGHLCHLLLPCRDRDNGMCSPAAPKCFFIPLCLQECWLCSVGFLMGMCCGKSCVMSLSAVLIWMDKQEWDSFLLLLFYFI